MRSLDGNGYDAPQETTSMLKKSLWALLTLLVVLAAVVAINTARKGSRQLQVAPLAPVAVDATAVAARLAEAVRLQTLSSRDDAQLSADQFKALHALLQARFPRVHAALQREVVGDLSLLYTWKGADPQARPIMLMAHQDVVPVAPGTEGDWAVPPFSGDVKDGFVWGRGSWDDKGNLMSQLEAVEMLVASGFQPERTVYLAYGADEEVSGQRGATQQIVGHRAVGEVLPWVAELGQRHPLAGGGVQRFGQAGLEASDQVERVEPLPALAVDAQRLPLIHT